VGHPRRTHWGEDGSPASLVGSPACRPSEITNLTSSLARILALVLVAAMALTWAFQAQAQEGPIGKREFAVTRTVEDPLVADELLFPSILHIKRPAGRGEPPTRETDVSGELLKTLTANFGVSLAGSLIHLDPDEAPTLTGFDNLEIGLKYAFFVSPTHETILSAGLGWEVGGTGRKAVADSFDVVRPAIFWGKGFGDLPEELRMLKPLAVTGVLGFEIPTRGTTRRAQVAGGQTQVDVQRNPNAFQWGFVVEYSLAYLQASMKDSGFRTPFKELIPVVELAFDTFLDRGSAGQTTGTVNPGIIWQGDSIQIGLEAVIPINERSGKNVGVQASLVFFFDELLPKSLGRPLFGR